MGLTAAVVVRYSQMLGEIGTSTLYNTLGRSLYCNYQCCLVCQLYLFKTGIIYKSYTSEAHGNALTQSTPAILQILCCDDIHSTGLVDTLHPNGIIPTSGA